MRVVHQLEYQHGFIDLEEVAKDIASAGAPPIYEITGTRLAVERDSTDEIVLTFTHFTTGEC